MTKTTSITVRPPSSALYASVDIHVDRKGESLIIGAAPAYELEEVRNAEGEVTQRIMHPAKQVAVDCYLEPQDKTLRCCWVHEQTNLGLDWTEHSVKRGSW